MGLMGIADILFFKNDVASHFYKLLIVWKSGCINYPNETISMVYNVHDIDVLFLYCNILYKAVMCFCYGCETK